MFYDWRFVNWFEENNLKSDFLKLSNKLKKFIYKAYNDGYDDGEDY